MHQICIMREVWPSFMCFKHVCYWIFSCFWFVLIGQNLTAQATGSHSCTGGRIQIPEMLLQALSPFSLLRAPTPLPQERACSQVSNKLILMWKIHIFIVCVCVWVGVCGCGCVSLVQGWLHTCDVWHSLPMQFFYIEVELLQCCSLPDL